MNKFLILFSVWSITNLIVHGTIFKHLRAWLLINRPFWGSMVTCMMCCSVWVSFVQSLLINLIMGPVLFENTFIDIMILTSSGSGFAYLLDVMIWKLFLKPSPVEKF